MLGLRIDKALSFVPEIGSRSRAEFLISQDLVRVNEKPVKSSYRITEKDLLTVTLPEAEKSELVPYDFPIQILHEDKDVIVVNKPAGLVVHPAAGHSQDTLVNVLLHHTDNLSMKFGENRPGIVHRLDKDTSGILVVAKNDFSHENLAQQFKARKVHRIYFAVCTGTAKTKSGTIESFIARHPTNRKKFASVTGKDKKIIHDKKNSPPVGKWSITHYEIIGFQKDFSYLRIKLETGRTHQIRVHLSEIGIPIAGDLTYAPNKKIDIPRFALHAAELGFVHPSTGENLFFRVPWPEDLSPFLKSLGFYEAS
jgi:23S rRNA pseudouridine1911/1915/1917 synthase